MATPEIAPRGSARTVLVIGQGYVGLTLAIRAVEAGFDLVAVERDATRLRHLALGSSYIEDVSDQRLRAALASGRYRAVDGVDGSDRFDVIVIAVPTPLLNGAPDLTFVEEACSSAARVLTSGCLVVLESTSFPGTTEGVVGPLLERGSGLILGVDFLLAYSPERIDPGNREWTFDRIPKVVSGINSPSLAAVTAFYDHLVERTVPVSGLREAELVKLFENTYRHVNIALANEFAILAHEVGIDIWETIRAATSKPFGFAPFRPGPGVGGHCLPIDVEYLSWYARQCGGGPFRFVELAKEINQYMPAYVVTRLIARLGVEDLLGSQVLLLGLSYKPDIADTRESPAFVVAEHLRARGAVVSATDPHVSPRDVPTWIKVIDLDITTVTYADAVVILADHRAFDLGLVAAHARLVFDCCRCVYGANVEHL